MLQIFKYFIGIIGILILIYALLVVLRNVTTGSISTDQNFEFSLVNWMKYFKPFEFSPIEVTTDRLQTRYYNSANNETDSFWKNRETRNRLYWQNLNEAPTSHPTDFAPIGDSYIRQLINGQTKDSNLIDPDRPRITTSSYISPSIQPFTVVEDISLLTGYAHYNFYTNRQFRIILLNDRNEPFTELVAYANGELGPDGHMPFRAVVRLPYYGMRPGTLVYQSLNSNLPEEEASLVLPVLFAK